MNITAGLARADRLQRSRLFKIIASAVLAVLAIGGLVAYAVAINTPSESMISVPEPVAPAADGSVGPTAAPGDQPSPSGAATPAELELDPEAQIINRLLAAKSDPTSVAVGAGIAVALALAVVWLGLGLTYLALGVLAATVLGLAAFAGVGRGWAPLALGVLALTGAFTTLMRLLAIVLSPSLAVLAVARNVLAEAVRLRVSLLFIVLLIFGLAALPGLLDPAQPLRYRVQSFLQYGTGGSFWLIAVLTVVFAAATVAFEQRDKVIWQTMTKPVAPWQYILGKWLGVSALAAVLLTVSASGIFLFVEYLRTQPAQDERSAYVAAAGQGITEDRLALETQILTARVARTIDDAELDDEQFEKNVEGRVEQELAALEEAGISLEERQSRRMQVAAKVRDSLRKSVQQVYRAIEPGQGEYFRFSGMKDARESELPLILRMKVDAGSNRPDAVYRVTMEFPASPRGGVQVEEVVLGQFMVFRLLPGVVDADGNVLIHVVNGDALRRTVNPETISFPPDGLEMSYVVGGYRANFARVMAVLWVKLAFLAMLGVCASTFLSFPVACLVSLTVFVSAEGAGFLLDALQNYATEDRDGKMLLVPTLIAQVARVVGTAFKVYAELKPTGRLVDGLRLGWGAVAGGAGVLAVWTVLLYGAAVLIFGRRELATYSGQ